MDEEPNKLNNYYEELIANFKKLNKKIKNPVKSKENQKELEILKNKILEFQKKYFPFIKQRKNGFGNFNLKKYSDCFLQNLKLKPINQIKSNVSSATLPNNLPIKNEPKNVEIFTKNEIFNLLMKQKTIKESKKIFTKELQDNDLLAKQCDKLIDSVILNSILVCKSRDNVLRKKDIRFAFKLLYGIETQENFKEESLFFMKRKNNL